MMLVGRNGARAGLAPHTMLWLITYVGRQGGLNVTPGSAGPTYGGCP